jgi:hypothetical protein
MEVEIDFNGREDHQRSGKALKQGILSSGI